MFDENIFYRSSSFKCVFFYFFLKTSRKSEKNIFCHYRFDNANFLVNLVDFDQFCEKTKWWPDRKWVITWKNKYQIPAQEVKRFWIDMFILYFDNFFLKKTKWRIDRKWCVARKKRNQIRAQEVRCILKNIFYLILTYFDNNTKWRPDDVIPEAVNINGSGSSAIPDIIQHFNTPDRNFEKIWYKLRPPQCRLKELKTRLWHQKIDASHNTSGNP